MKKAIAMMIALMMMAMGCSALAEQLPDWLQDSVDGAVWVDDRASLEVLAEDDGYQVLILWGSSAWETTEWVYSCVYDAEKGQLTAVHMICDNLVFDESGKETRTSVLDQDCETAFALNDEGKIVITNAADESLEGKIFERMPVEEGEF